MNVSEQYLLKQMQSLAAAMSNVPQAGSSKDKTGETGGSFQDLMDQINKAGNSSSEPAKEAEPKDTLKDKVEEVKSEAVNAEDGEQEELKPEQLAANPNAVSILDLFRPDVVQTAEETDRMMANTDPRYVFLCYDTGHFTFAGEDLLAMLKKYVGRVGHVHLKDMRLPVVEEARKNNWSFLQAVRNGAFTVPGDGDVDFDPVFKVLSDAGYQGWLLVEAEQDPAKADPLAYAIKARKYIREHTGL